MKKYLSIIAFSLLFPVFSFASYCTDFSSGKLCIDVRKTSDGSLEIVKSLKEDLSKKVFMLNCKVLLPNKIQKDLGACSKKFSYNFMTGDKLTFDIYLDGENERFIYNSSDILSVNQVPLSSSKQTLSVKQYSDLVVVKNLWSKVIDVLIQKYPYLIDDSKFVSMSDDFYSDLSNFIDGKNSRFDSYISVKSGLLEFVSYTKKLIKQNSNK